MNNSNLLLEHPDANSHKSNVDNHQVLMALAGIFGGWLMIASIMILGEIDYTFLNLNLFPLSLLIVGLGSTIYYHSQESMAKDHFSLITPTTNDPFIHKWLIHTFFVPAVMVLSFWSYSIFADEFYYQYSGVVVASFNPIQGWSIPYIEAYFGCQFIFLIGNFIFRKASIPLQFIGRLLTVFLKNLLQLLLSIILIRTYAVNLLKSFCLHYLTKIEKREQIKIS